MDIIKSIRRDRSLLYLLEFEVPDGLEFEQVSWQSTEIPGGNNKNSNWSFRQTARDIGHLFGYHLKMGNQA